MSPSTNNVHVSVDQSSLTYPRRSHQDGERKESTCCQTSRERAKRERDCFRPANGKRASSMCAGQESKREVRDRRSVG